MKNSMETIAGLAIVLGFLILSGCSKNTKVISGPSNTFVLSVQPTSGAVDVPISSSVQIIFASPMDTLSVAQNFCLIGGEMMYQVMDSLEHAMMDYSEMMEWMHSSSLPGHFQWNSKRDSCLFLPDLSLIHHTEHMIYMGRNMESRHSDMMMEHREMMGEDFITHFTTEDN